jgi:hypothetical protein
MCITYGDWFFLMELFLGRMSSEKDNIFIIYDDNEPCDS